MTSEEFIPLAKGMRAAYCAQSFLPDEEALKLWYRMLKDLDGKLVAAAVYKHIASSKFPPTIADIREAAAELKAGEAKDWLEGWGKVVKAIGRHGWCGEREALRELRDFDPLAADIAAQLGWRNLCESTNQSADRANFRKAYETTAQRKKELAKLPPGVTNMLKGVSEQLKLEGV